MSHRFATLRIFCLPCMLALGCASVLGAQTEDKAVEPQQESRRAETPTIPSVAAISRAHAMVMFSDSADAYLSDVRGRPRCAEQEEGLLNGLPAPFDVVYAFSERPYDQAAAPTAEQIAKAIGIVSQARRELGQCGAGSPTTSDLANAAPAAVKSAAANAFFPSQTALVVGLTDFMVSRARDEAVFSFLLRLRNAVEEKPLVTVGMPRSWALMSRLEDGSYQTLLPAVRTAFAEDLTGLPRQLNSPALRTQMGWGNTTPTYVQAMAVAYERGVEIRNGLPPLAAVQNLIGVSEDQVGNDTARAVMHIVGLASREYVVGGRDTLIQELSANSDLRGFFLAFVVNDAAELDFRPSARVDVLQRAKTGEQHILQLLQQVHVLAQTMRTLDVSQDATVLTNNAVVGIGAMLQVVGAGQHFLPLRAEAEVRVFDQVIEDALILHQAVISREYSRIITWLSSRESVIGTIDPNVFQYLVLASSLAAARDADDVTLALQTAAAPVGSYRSKRYQPSRGGDGNFFDPRKWKPQSVSLVGYLGGRVGREGIQGESRDSWFAGAALPVGVEISSAIPYGAISLFAPILDLGTIATARWDTPDDGTSTSDIGFEQVLAPGLFLVYNIGGVPISIGGGIQAVPNARVNSEGREMDAYRWGGFIGVDAPLFHFRFRKSARRLQPPRE